MNKLTAQETTNLIACIRTMFIILRDNSTVGEGIGMRQLIGFCLRDLGKMLLERDKDMDKKDG